jgi:hypothetical protein
VPASPAAPSSAPPNPESASEVRPTIARSYKLTGGGNTIEISGETLSAEVEPNGTLYRTEHISLEYKSQR